MWSAIGGPFRMLNLINFEISYNNYEIYLKNYEI